jgi:hypothetical protein
MIRVKLPDGRYINVETEDPQAASKAAQTYYANSGTPARPTRRQMREIADPGYRKARQKTDELARTRDRGRAGQQFGAVGGFLDALGDWTAQVAANTGAADEVTGAMTAGLQGVENVARRVAGRPVEIPMNAMFQATADDVRERQAQYARRYPGRNAAATVATIAASARPTGAATFRNPVAAGAAATVQNAPFAVARQEGNLRQRAPGAARESAMTFGMGAGLQAGANRLAQAATAARARPLSDARQISNQGVTLTPGQMMGGTAQRAEDALTSVPVAGDAVRAARVRGIESFDRAAIDRTLAPIGHGLAPDANVGREGVQAARQTISQAYEDALRPVAVAPDAAWDGELTAILARPNLPRRVRNDLTALLGDIRARMAGGLDGRAWKQIDSELASAVRAADNASGNDPASRFLRDALADTRTAHQNLLERTDPNVFGMVRAADEATANLARVTQASQYTGTSARGGVFSPADLNRAVQAGDSSAGNRQFAQGQALMQDLTDPAMRVLPQQVPDSGTPFRSLMTGLGLTGGGAALGVDPTMLMAAGAGVAGVAGLYSRPVQGGINAMYRAAQPGAGVGALERLARAAARDPALVPLYEEALAAAGLPPASYAGPNARQGYLREPTTR